MVEDSYREKKEELDEKHAQELSDLREQKAQALAADLNNIKQMANGYKRKRNEALMFDEPCETPKLLMSGDYEEVCVLIAVLFIRVRLLLEN
jgi:hypothetical protein